MWTCVFLVLLSPVSMLLSLGGCVWVCQPRHHQRSSSPQPDSRTFQQPAVLLHHHPFTCLQPLHHHSLHHLQLQRYVDLLNPGQRSACQRDALHVAHGQCIHGQHSQHIGDHVPFYTVAHRSCAATTRPVAGRLSRNEVATGLVAVTV
ncbi:uncharacterized protein LOC109201561 [Oreochromis niloticus]|uniref:uncharacterized protein LOC109201561 n=1 Tax=Oreochromis niloticus TaxID=8128 RepID=UPI000904B305|nr:uncharacterized protein LOC109201561 [Oreochromis niloticus]